MRVVSPGNVFLIDRHLERLSHSAEYFSFDCDVESARRDILLLSAAETPSRLRLILFPDGRYELERTSLPASNPCRLTLSLTRVNSRDPFLYHKTTRRGPYDDARMNCDANSDVVLVNERGEVTETTIANIAVFRDRKWVTPPVRCGLLPGVMRTELMARGEIVEGVIAATELRLGQTIRCFNALRGVFDAELKG